MFERIEERAVLVARVGAERFRPKAVAAADMIEHGVALNPFGVSVGSIDGDVHAQSVAILHADVGTVAEQGRLALAFSGEFRVRIDDAAMRLVAALLIADVDRGIAWIVIV